MSEISTSTSTNVIEILLRSLQVELPKTQRISNLVANNTKDSSAKTLNEEAIALLESGDYDVSLREFTSFSTYLAQMTSMYGNKSSNRFQQTINNILNTGNENSVANAKSFIDKMKEKGVSNSSAIKLYSAIQSYSLVSTLNNNSYVSATV